MIVALDEMRSMVSEEIKENKTKNKKKADLMKGKIGVEKNDSLMTFIDKSGIYQ